jgi:glycosyltransferase involved in cell wall biosynthesis
MKSQNIKISVVIPVYNSSETILRALESVVNQTLEPHEIIIINDGSKDNSLTIIKNYIKEHSDFNFKLIDKKNGGVSSARNAGLKIASGNWIALLDSDDIWHLNKLELQIKLLKENKEIDFLGSSRNDERLFLFGKEITENHKATIKELLFKMYPQTSTAIFRRSLFEKYGGYNEDMTHAEDGFLWVTYCAHSNFYYMPVSLVLTGNGKPSFGHSGLSENLKEMYKGNLLILKEVNKNKFINNLDYYFFLALYGIKHLRRVILTKLR